MGGAKGGGGSGLSWVEAAAADTLVGGILLSSVCWVSLCLLRSTLRWKRKPKVTRYPRNFLYSILPGNFCRKARN